MGTGSKEKLYLIVTMFDISLLQPLWGFSWDNKGARRHSPSLLLPHLLPQVHSHQLPQIQLLPRDRSGESAKGKWRTHDPIFSGLIKCLGLENTFSSSPPVVTQNNEQVWPARCLKDFPCTCWKLTSVPSACDISGYIHVHILNWCLNRKSIKLKKRSKCGWLNKDFSLKIIPPPKAWLGIG